MAASADSDMHQISAQISQMIKSCRQDVQQKPTEPNILGALHGCLQTFCDWDDYEDRMKKLPELIDKHLQLNLHPPAIVCPHWVHKILKIPASGLVALSLQQRFNMATYCAQLQLNSQKCTTPVIQYHLSGTRLRVGYIFTGASQFPLLKKPCRHDKERFEVFYYRYHRGVGNLARPPTDDQFTNEHLVDLTKFKGNEAAAKRIAADFIHILVSLDDSLEENDELNEILSLRPAPIQAVYRSFRGTTGATYTDYFITDKVASPLQFAYGYSEKLAYMPNGMFVCDNLEFLTETDKNPEETEELRRLCYLPESAVVFAVRSDSFQIDPYTFDSWCEILRKVPKSVLWLLAGHVDQAQINLKREAKRRKINPNRLIFIDESVKKDLDWGSVKNLIDLALDTPVFNAEDTINLIIGGIPVITMPRELLMSRMTASMLTSIGCEELIVDSREKYVEMAVNLGTNAEQLREMRAKMSENLPNSNLFRIDQYFNDLENLYQKMWERKEMGEKPDHIV